MRALKTCKDDFGVVRKNGEEWLIKMSDTETHIPNVYEEVDFTWHCVVVNYSTLPSSLSFRLHSTLKTSFLTPVLVF